MVKENSTTKLLKKSVKKSSHKKEIIFNDNKVLSNNDEKEHIIAFKERMNKNWEVNIEPSYKNPSPLSKKANYRNSKNLNYFIFQKHHILFKLMYFVASKRIKKIL